MRFAFVAAVGGGVLEDVAVAVFQLFLGRWTCCLRRDHSCRRVRREELNLYHTGNIERIISGGLCGAMRRPVLRLADSLGGRVRRAGLDVRSQRKGSALACTVFQTFDYQDCPLK